MNEIRERVGFENWFDAGPYGNCDGYIYERMWAAWKARADAGLAAVSEPTTGHRPINKQVPEETFSDEIASGYRKRCGHIAECDCINGAKLSMKEVTDECSDNV